MKRIALLLINCLIAAALQAQNGHLKFMGIPLNGTINQFQQKLIAKGVKPYADFNELAQDEPVRYFSGNFAGNKALIKIKYNNKTKIVWGAMVLIEYTDSKYADSQLDYYKKKLLSKYPYSKEENVLKNGIPTIMISVVDPKDFLGFIYLYTVKGSTKVNLILNYKDYSNTEANEKENLKDL